MSWNELEQQLLEIKKETKELLVRRKELDERLNELDDKHKEIYDTLMDTLNSSRAGSIFTEVYDNKYGSVLRGF